MSAPDAGGPWRARRARDFYFELISHSQAPRTGVLAERERWLRGLKVEGREELVFELELLLRGLERYFNLQNLPPSEAPVVARDFRGELTDVWDALSRVIGLSRLLLDPEADQKRVFRRYVESQLSDDRVRRALLEQELDEDSPPDSLFVLRESFLALKDVLEHLLASPSVSYQLFANVGTLALGDLVKSRFFRPSRPLEFRLEYDRVKSVPLLLALQALPEGARGAFCALVLALFRLLHCVSYVGGPEAAPGAGRAHLVLALIRSESVSLAQLLTAELLLQLSSRKHQAFFAKAAQELLARTEAIFQTLHGRAQPGTLAPAAAAYAELFRAQLTRVGKLLAPSDGLDFDSLTAAPVMARRLQTDLWAFAELCRAVEGAFHGEPERAEAALAALRRYLRDFEAVGYQLLRYGDIEPFDRFFAIIAELPGVPKGPVARARLGEDCRLFAETARTTFTAVSRRAELKDPGFDLAQARSVLARYWP